MSASFDLRPYQEASLEQLRDGIRQGKKRQVLCLPTGAGKTHVAMALVEGGHGAKRIANCYFLADRRSTGEPDVQPGSPNTTSPTGC